MSRFAKYGFMTVLVAIVAFSAPAFASNVTISGSATFASLDGSAQDDDHTVNGVFTVNGDLTVLGSITCNDASSGAGSSACPMAFNVSGNVTLAAGSSLFAENRNSDGNGANISVIAGGNVLLQGTSGATAGAIVSSSKLNGGNNFHAGDITFNAGGTMTQEGGSVIAATAQDSFGGAISITTGLACSIGGQILSGPTRTISTSTLYTGVVMSGGGGHYVGGPITIKALTHSEPGLIITASAIIASQGSETGTTTGSPVTLEGCGVNIDGLVASLAQKASGPGVIVRGGTTITIDSSTLATAGGTHEACLRSDATHEDASAFYVNLFAKNAITVIGPPTSSALFSVTSNPGTTDKRSAGTINVISTSGTVTASGNAFQVSGTRNGDRGGTVNVSAKDVVTLTGATIDASGSTSDANRAGGHINVRSYSASLNWLSGVGDVRPVGSAAGVPTAQQGTISLTYCTTLSTSGTSFPANGSPVGVFPTTTQTCSPAAPTLPAGNTLPNCNAAPIANNDSYTVAEGGTLTVTAPGVLGNDSDPDGDPITAILVSGPAHAASFTFNADGSFTYVHDGSETTSDSFTYKANDGSLDSNVATVNITVTPVNDAPVANNDAYTVAEGGSLNVAAPGVLANDTDPDGPTMTAILVSGPAHASSFSLNANGSVLYVHDGSETTSDSFTYKVNDGSLDSNVATVNITVTPVNDAPTANNDAYNVNEGGTLTVAAPGVLGNDTDPDSPSLTAVLVSGPAHATSFTFNANGSFSYVHDGSETTSDSFTYKANDGSLDSNIATVFITVNPVNDAPVAVNDSYNVNEGGTLSVPAPGVLGNDTDPDSPTLNAVLVSGPAHASSFALNANGSFTYVHDGSETTTDSFTYKANDGSLDSNVATVTITINPVNDAPTAVNDSYNVNEGGTLNVAAPGVLGNDTDPDSPSLTAILVTGPAHASSFTLNSDGSFTYVHDGSETTSDTFTYKANDGSLDSNVATVTIHVAPVDDPPVAVPDAYSVNEGGTLSVPAPGVLGNDTDVDGPSIHAVLVSGPAHAASFVLNADGSFNYVHDGSETNVDSFTYKANDGTLDSNVATVTITVIPVNDAPVITAGGTLNYTEGDPATVIDNSITVTDADSLTLTGATVQISANYNSGQDVLSFTNTASITGTFNGGTGILTLTGTDTVANYQAALRSVKYANTSNNPSTAPRTVSWQVNDGAAINNLSNVATSTINVISVNDAPVLANGSTISYTENDPATVIDNVITVSDTDSPNLIGATVQITGNYANGQDVLSFTNALGITGSFNASTGTLTLSGTSSVANYQTALRSVKYTNTSDDPSTAARTVSFQVNDGGSSNNLSNIVTSTINITAVNDPPTAHAYAGLGAQAGIPISFAAGTLFGTDVEAGTTVTVDTTPINVINGTVSINADGSFTFTPAITAAGGTASFQYRVSDNGNPAPGQNSAYVAVSFTVAGPGIYFTRSAAAGSGNCTLTNECTVATAVSLIGSSTDRAIFIGDANTQSPGTITLNSGGSIIGQGVTGFASFDALFGITPPPMGTLAPRPAVGQPRPTLSSSNITLNKDSKVRGFNLSSALGESLVASSRTGLVVSDLDVTSTTNISTQSVVHFTSSSGTFSFGNVTVSGGNAGAGVNFSATTSSSTASFGNVSTGSGTALSVSSSGSTNFTFGNVSTTTGQAVNVNTGSGSFTFAKISAGTSIAGPAKAIQVNNVTGGFTVSGSGGLCDATHTSGSDCTGGTIQKASARGAEFIGSNNVTLNNMLFKGDSTTVAAGCVADVSSGSNATCNGPVFAQNVNGLTLSTVFVDGSSQMGVVGNNVTAFHLTDSEVRNIGSSAGTGQSAVDLQNVLGTSTISGSHLHDSDFGHEVFITNNSGTANITISNNTIDNVTITTPALSDGVQVQSYATANVTVSVTNGAGTCTFNKLFGNGVSLGSNGASVMNATLSNCNVNKTTGVLVDSTGTSSMTASVTGNTIANKIAADGFGTGSSGITIGKASGASAGTFVGVVTNNNINKANCGGGCLGIDGAGFGNGSTTMTISNNLVQHADGGGIRYVAGQGTGNNIVTVQGNNITNPDSDFIYAIDMEAGSSGTDNVCLAANIGDMSPTHNVPANANTITNGSSGHTWLSYNGDPGTTGSGPAIGPITFFGTFKLFNYTGSTDAQAQAWIVASNPGTSSDAFGPFSGGNTCP